MRVDCFLFLLLGIALAVLSSLSPLAMTDCIVLAEYSALCHFGILT